MNVQGTNATLEMYCEFLETIPDAALLAHNEGDFVWANQVAVALFGDSVDGLWAQNVRPLVAGYLREVYDLRMQQYWHKPVAEPMGNIERLTVLREDGTQISIDIALNHLELEDGRYTLGTFRDVSQAQRHHNQLENALNHERHLAATDPLTGAANRRYFGEELLSEIERASRNARVFSLAYLDLDNFKDINDRYGHAQGDKLLQQIVKAAQVRLRKSDLIARLGGDEFAVLLPETDTTITEAPITDLLKEMKQSMHESGWPVTISCGVVTFRAHPGSAEKAINAADQLMYEVKAAGKNASRIAVFEREDS